MVNISDHTLCESELSVLRKGLNFIPTPKEPDISVLNQDLSNFARRMRLTLHFFESETIEENFDSKLEQTFRQKSSWTPTVR